MDKEDAAAMHKATEGELAFQQDDKSPSQQMLDEIMNRLQSGSVEENRNRSMASMNLSMDANPFDTIDMQLGAAATTKEGEALYRTSLPVCEDIAAEVCAADEIDTVKGAYLMTIEQDCNTVAQAFETKHEQALAKAKEGSALLDMARLNNYQTRNSDDILACKKKMMTALAGDVACGPDLGKCLDWSGKYINPATGEPRLTEKLPELANMITRPRTNQTWAKVPQNKRFVDFLNSKKKYIEPAMVACEKDSEVIWGSFIEDALAEIRIAQGRKLETLRESCTSVQAMCIEGMISDLSLFDTNALSVLGVHADRTANDVCTDTRKACTALMDQDALMFEGEKTFEDAMVDIAALKTYEQIVQTCTEVGRNCIIDNCMNNESKFALCTDVKSQNRKNIVNRKVCWDQVAMCVASAGYSTLNRIVDTTGIFGYPKPTNNPINIIEEMQRSTRPLFSAYSKDLMSVAEPRKTLNEMTLCVDSGVCPLDATFNTCITTLACDTTPTDEEKQICRYRCWYRTFKTYLYCPINTNLIDAIDESPYRATKDIHLTKAAAMSVDKMDADWCRITEKIWGYCDRNSRSRNNSEKLDEDDSPGGDIKPKIIPEFGGLLKFLYENTGQDSCSGGGCDPGEVFPTWPSNMSAICQKASGVAGDGAYCQIGERFNVTGGLTNCCQDGSAKAQYANNKRTNCCWNGEAFNTNSCSSNNYICSHLLSKSSTIGNLCAPGGLTELYLVARYAVNRTSNGDTLCPHTWPNSPGPCTNSPTSGSTGTKQLILLCAGHWNFDADPQCVGKFYIYNETDDLYESISYMGLLSASGAPLEVQNSYNTSYTPSSGSENITTSMCIITSAGASDSSSCVYVPTMGLRVDIN